MLFKYKIVDKNGTTKIGEIEAIDRDFAISALQKRGFIVISVEKTEKGGLFGLTMSFTDKIPMKDIVMVSRQLSTLFESQVSVVKTFSLIGENVQNLALRNAMMSITSDVEGGMSISNAMKKHPKAFSKFFVNMVSAGEESGRLQETFMFLADYIERQHELNSKAKNALIYPSFVVVTFIGVMTMVLTVIIPKLGEIINESGQDVPVYTKLVLWLSDFFVHYGIFLVVLIVITFVFVAYSLKAPDNRRRIDALKLKIPYIGKMFRMLYLSRISDNIRTMLSAGIPVVRTIEITATLIGNTVYEDILNNTAEAVKGGKMISQAMSQYEELPNILVQMIRVGEQSGSLARILGTLSKFYKREVDSSIDTVIGLIEPALIIALALGVGILLASVLMPIYDIAGGIS